MTISELSHIFNTPVRQSALFKLLKNDQVNTIHLQGLQGSSLALALSLLLESENQFIFIANDLEEAGYLYHDLVQINGDQKILFFPSAYKRQIKYGQLDPSNEILRTETLNRLSQYHNNILVITYPEALAEKVVSNQLLTQKTLSLSTGEKVSSTFVADVLFEYGFERVDYVYEPGQYAVRGSILDVFSFSSDYPYRIDFFGDEIDSIRTFEIETQLSKER